MGNEVCMEQAQALLDEQGNPSGWYKQIVSKVDDINGNTRLYPRMVYYDALEKLKSAGFPYAGEHPHPSRFQGKDGKIHFKTSIPNSAVKFRDAYIDEQNNVWAEYKPLDTEMGKQVKTFLENNLPIGFSNRMTGNSRTEKRNGKMVQIATKLKLYTWDVVLNPAEQNAFQLPIVLIDELGEENCMDFFNMSLEELQKWKEQNADAEEKEMLLCNQVIALKQEAESAKEQLQAKNNEIEAQKQKKQAQQFLTDEIEKLNYDKNVKEAILRKGGHLDNKEKVSDFLEKEKAFMDSLEIGRQLKQLGVPQQQEGKAKIYQSEQQENSFVDDIMKEMDNALLKKDMNFTIDKELRKANNAILEEVFQGLKRKDCKTFFDSIESENRTFTDETSPSIGDSGQFAQSAHLSLAIIKQMWQDLKFLQLCMVESFSGKTFKMPVEFQSHDLYSEDDFAVGELDSIPTESVQTFLLEYGGFWLKQGFVVTKEAERELKSGPMKYDVIAANMASLSSRFQRIIDQAISTEMLGRADEYGAIKVLEEAVAASEAEELTEDVNIPVGSNAKIKVSLLCGHTSPLNVECIAPVVRPRKTIWLDRLGRKQEEWINDIIVKNSSGKVLRQGRWIASKGLITNKNGLEADYAVDFENACVYFKEDAISKTALPKISYSYATNIVFFNLNIPKALEENSARYYNKLLELMDIQKAYMGSAPRYVTPDFALGSLNAMALVKQAELFYQKASPNGTTLGGNNYFAKRNGLDLCEHNAPWAAGDSRILLGKKNAVRFGMGSPYELEGPYPYRANGGYTSAKEYFATQQVAINTPLVIDENGKQYHPPFRSIKFYHKEY